MAAGLWITYNATATDERAMPAWQHFVLGPTDEIARPVRVVSTNGRITDAEALVANDSRRVATLTRTADEIGPTNIILDYGIEVGGLPMFDVASSSGSARLQASYSESLSYLTPEGDHGPSHSADLARYDSYLVGEPGLITNTFTQGGERYQMVSLTSPGTVRIHAVGIRIGFYCADARRYRGHFVCNDEELNKIWYACAYTVETNMIPPGSVAAPRLPPRTGATPPGSNAVAPDDPTTGVPNSALVYRNSIPVIVDGAKRDRSVWSGDLEIQGRVLYYSTGATEYVRESLRLLGSYGASDGRVSTNLPSEWPVGSGPTADSAARIYSANYTLWWAEALADYYLFTGDLEFLKQEWPILSREVDWAATHVRNDGLLVTNLENGHDWDYYDGPKVGAVTGYNALYYRVLNDSAMMAEDLGYGAEARKYRSLAGALAQAVTLKLFNRGTGIFDASDLNRGSVAQDANVYAVAFGLVSKDAARGILAKLKGSLWTDRGPKPFSNPAFQNHISPYVSGFELLARLQCDDTEGAIQLMRCLWGPMVRPSAFYTGTVWEIVDPDGTPGLQNQTSLAHGWSAAPATALSGFILGIQPVAAGYRVWRVKPHPGNLKWAEGSAPTPKGQIAVSWSCEIRSARFKMNISTPIGTTGEIAVPTFGKRISVLLNNKMVWDGEKSNGFNSSYDEGYISLKDIPGGMYSITTLAPN